MRRNYDRKTGNEERKLEDPNETAEKRRKNGEEKIVAFSYVGKDSEAKKPR